MIIFSKKKREELAENLALNITNYEKVIQEFKDQVNVLTRERDAAKANARDTTNKCKLLESISNRLRIELEDAHSELEASQQESERTKNRIKVLKNDSVSKKQELLLREKRRENSKLRETIVKNNDELKELKRRLSCNKDYRETYEFIANKNNRKEVIDNFSYNLDQYINKKYKGVTITKLSEVLGVNRDMIRELRNGVRVLTVENVKVFDEGMCDFYNCSLGSLVKEKLEVPR